MKPQNIVGNLHREENRLVSREVGCKPKGGNIFRVVGKQENGSLKKIKLIIKTDPLTKEDLKESRKSSNLTEKRPRLLVFREIFISFYILLVILFTGGPKPLFFKALRTLRWNNFQT